MNEISSNFTVHILVLLLLFATIYDLKYQLIKNWLCGLVFILAVTTQFLNNSWYGIGEAFAACIVAFLCFIPFYAKKVMGAGDVKLMAACGAFLGFPAVFYGLAYTLMAGAVLGFLYLIIRGEVIQHCRRWSAVALHTFATKSMTYYKPEADSASAHYFPYASAITAGTLLAIYL